MLAIPVVWRAFIVCVCMGSLLQSFGQHAGTLQGDGDVAADIVLTDELVEACLGEYFHDLGVHTREYDAYILLQALLAQVGEVVHAGRVDEGYLTHADDAH